MFGQRSEHRVRFLGCPVQDQEWDLRILKFEILKTEDSYGSLPTQGVLLLPYALIVCPPV